MPRMTPNELLIQQRLLALSRSLPGARKGDVQRLHQARVATRRLREALPTLTTGTKGRKLVRDVRRLTRAFGPVRELDVVMLTLDELAAEQGAPTAAIGKVRRVIKEERDRLHGEMCEQVDRVDLAKLKKRAVSAHRKGGDPKQLSAARRRAAKRADRLRAAIENAAGIYLPDRLHQVRIAVKKLRYSMELTRELSGSRATTRLNTLKETQDLLGRMNDLEVLIARVRAIQGSGKVPDLRTSSDLDRVVRRLETECRELHSQYVASRRRLLAICDHASAAAEARGGTRAA